MPEGATPSEIRFIGGKFYVSVRTDQGFKPNDSMVTLERSPKNGAVRVSSKSDAWGKVPRTFAINRAGDLVAIGNQASANVAIVRRDRQTGELGKVGSAEGLSSVIWEE
jgi:6-phosphogluconolactonase (cycloisomerase 2 family)